jgi:hypothetical protein
VAGLFKITDFCPLVLRDIVDFAFLASLVWVLAANSVDKVLGLELKLSVQMGKLMSTSRRVHESLFLDFIGLFVDDVALVRKHRTNFVFFLFASNKENLVLSLNGSELLG